MDSCMQAVRSLMKTIELQWKTKMIKYPWFHHELYRFATWIPSIISKTPWLSEWETMDFRRKPCGFHIRTLWMSYEKFATFVYEPNGLHVGNRLLSYRNPKASVLESSGFPCESYGFSSESYGFHIVTVWLAHRHLMAFSQQTQFFFIGGL